MYYIESDALLSVSLGAFQQLVIPLDLVADEVVVFCYKADRVSFTFCLGSGSKISLDGGCQNHWDWFFDNYGEGLKSKDNQFEFK